MAATKRTEQEPDGVAAVDRALSIVAALEAGAEPQSLAQLARATDLYKSTILRLLVTLERRGYVTQLRSGAYSLGPAAFRLGLAYERANRLRELVLPVLEDLVAQGTESASFHIRHDAENRLCLFRVDSHHSTLDRVHAGDILPLRRGAAGRIILAFDDEPGAHFEALRREYFTVSKGERDPSCAGMAAPVFGPDGRGRGAVSLSGPGERFTAAAIARMRPPLMSAAAAITRLLGGRYPPVPPGDAPAPKTRGRTPQRPR